MTTKSTLIFEPTATSSKGWTVREKQTAEVIGSIEWHDRLGVFGFGPSPGRSFRLEDHALEQLAQFLDTQNAERQTVGRG